MLLCWLCEEFQVSFHFYCAQSLQTDSEVCLQYILPCIVIPERDRYHHTDIDRGWIAWRRKVCLSQNKRFELFSLKDYSKEAESASQLQLSLKSWKQQHYSWHWTVCLILIKIVWNRKKHFWHGMFVNILKQRSTLKEKCCMVNDLLEQSTISTTTTRNYIKPICEASITYNAST